MKRTTCLVLFYVIGGLTATTFILPDVFEVTGYFVDIYKTVVYIVRMSAGLQSKQKGGLFLK